MLVVTSVSQEWVTSWQPPCSTHIHTESQSVRPFHQREKGGGTLRPLRVNMSLSAQHPPLHLKEAHVDGCHVPSVCTDISQQMAWLKMVLFNPLPAPNGQAPAPLLDSGTAITAHVLTMSYCCWANMSVQTSGTPDFRSSVYFMHLNAFDYLIIFFCFPFRRRQRQMGKQRENETGICEVDREKRGVRMMNKKVWCLNKRVALWGKRDLLNETGPCVNMPPVKLLIDFLWVWEANLVWPCPIITCPLVK